MAQPPDVTCGAERPAAEPGRGPEGIRGTGTGRAVLGGLLAGALLVGPFALLSADPARAAVLPSPLFGHPLDIHIDLGSRVGKPSPPNLDGLFGQVSRGAGGLFPGAGLPTAPAPASRPGGGTGTRAGSSGGGGTGSRPAPASTLPPDANADLDAAIPTESVPTDARGAAGQAPLVAASAAATPASGVAEHPVLAHSQLISSGDGARIVALDALAVVLAGVGLVGAPAALAIRRRAGR